MHTLALVALLAVATLWTGAFAMWVLGLPRTRTRASHRLPDDTFPPGAFPVDR